MTASNRWANEPGGEASPSTAGMLSLAIRAKAMPCLVVGGGRVGARKALTLLRAGAKVTVLSPMIAPRLWEYVRRGRIAWRSESYAASYLAGFRLVVAATRDPGVNAQIGRDAEASGILACVASDANASHVVFPAVLEADGLVVAVHSHGRDCRRSQALRNRIARWLNAGAGGDDSLLHTGAGNVSLFQRAEKEPSVRGAAATGKVLLVGAGPGAPDLISLRGLHALQKADAILVDQLLPATFLQDLGISTAGKIIQCVGDEEGHWSQDRIHRWLVAQAASGKTVVRLQGGDPFVFGRGDAEVEWLARHGIAWEAIPGMSSATAVPGGAGLSLTRRGRGRSFAVATARLAGGRVADAFPRADSLVILMGAASADQVAARLLADGWPRDAPAAMIERGTLPWERRAAGSLGDLGEWSRQAGIASPAVIVVGEAARPPEDGRCRPVILFTGLDPSNFRALGDLLHWPAQAAVLDPGAPRRLARAIALLRRGKWAWIAFADKVGAAAFATAMADQRLDARCLSHARIAALGTETARRLEQNRMVPDVVLKDERALDASTWLERIAGERVLVVRGTHVPHGFYERLARAGAAVETATTHRLEPHPELGRPLASHDVIYFVSPSGVRAYAEAYGREAFRQEVWCLGRATQRAIRGHGVEAAIVAPPHAPSNSAGTDSFFGRPNSGWRPRPKNVPVSFTP